MNMRTSNREGFTLSELLVTTVIVGTLAALLLTAVSKSKSRALRIQCVNNLRQQGLGLQTLVNDNKVYPLLIGKNEDLPVGARTTWEFAVALALGNKPGFKAQPTGVWVCPAVVRWVVKIPGGVLKNDQDYGYNGFGLSRLTARDGDPDSLGLGGHNAPNTGKDSSLGPPVSPSEVVNPSEMISIADGFAGKDRVILGLNINLSRNMDWNNWENPAHLNYEEITKQSYARHQGKANVVFCDGHVESPTLKYLFIDTSDEALSRWNRDHLAHRERLLP